MNLDLPEDIREPLHSLQADARYLLARAAQEADIIPLLTDSILDRLSQIETGIYRLIASQDASQLPSEGKGRKG